AARQEAANPLAAAWGESKSLLDVLDGTPEEGKNEVRLRLRAVLRRTTESIWLLVVPRGLDRLAAVQVWFAGGTRCRSCVIYYRPAHHFRRSESEWWARSLAAVAGPVDLDLRNPDHARRLEAVLQAADLTAAE